MIILVGESSSGKSTVEKILNSDLYNFAPIVSYTTRQRRKGERDGVDYHFVTDAKFNQLKEKGFFLESSCYNGWQYGSAKEDYKSNTVAVLTPTGLRKLKKEFDGKKVIFSVYIEVDRRERLVKILQRGDNIEEAYRRNLSDVGQFDGVSEEVDYIVHNSFSLNTKTPYAIAGEIVRKYKLG